MKQVIQDIRSGQTRIAEIPVPMVVENEMLVAVLASVISAGTERYVVELSRKNLFLKAKDRPDHVRRIIQKIRREGLRSTFQQVQERLDEPMPLGYSAAGVVIDCGAGIRRFRPGDRVAVAAPHAEIVSIGQNQCARVPDDVAFEDAAYTGIAAIALQGVRLARVSLGEQVVVIGLGLIGLLTTAFLKAQGCRVFGLDIDPDKLAMAARMGADAVGIGSPAEAIAQFTRRRGADAVILCTATSSNEPVEFAAEIARPKGRIVLVGVAGLTLPRPPFFQKELEFCVSSSMGPGRNDPVYERKGVDYPIGHARWTMQRNMEAVLDQMAAGELNPSMLTSHRFGIDEAPRAYDLLVRKQEPCLGIVLSYPERAERGERRLNLSVRRSDSQRLRVSIVGAGNYGRLVTLPILAALPDIELRGICTAKGLSAAHAGSKHGFAFATSDFNDILADRDTDAVLVLTRHNLHAQETAAALAAGKHVFVQKPLCITPEELRRFANLRAEIDAAARLLMVGFNRRFAPAIQRVADHFKGIVPLSVAYRFAAADLPADAWPQDFEVGGGRIVGEACHALDACMAITGSPAIRVYAECVAPVGSTRTPDDRVFISMRHANGSVSSVSYQAGGDPAAPKERVEVSGGGRTASAEAFNAIEMWTNGRRTTAKGGRDMGQTAVLAAFVRACREGGSWPVPWDQVYAAAWAPLAAVQSLRTGAAVDLDTPLD